MNNYTGFESFYHRVKNLLNTSLEQQEQFINGVKNLPLDKVINSADDYKQRKVDIEVYQAIIECFESHYKEDKPFFFMETAQWLERELKGSWLSSSQQHKDVALRLLPLWNKALFEEFSK